MAFDFKKIIDFLNPSYAQLRGLLITSLGTIGAVWVISSKTSDFRNQTKETNELTKQNTEVIRDMQSELEKSKSASKEDINKLYLDILDMNERNNTYLNGKFNMLIEYGSSNKNILKDMMKSLDDQHKLYEQDRLKNMEYWNSIKPPLTKPDTLNTNIIVRPVLPGEKPGQVKKIDNK